MATNGNKGTSRSLGDSSLTPSSYSVRSIDMTTRHGVIDISNLVNKFEITEALDQPYVMAVLTIVDATNFLEEHKLVGNEEVYIHVSRTPKSDNKDPAQFKLTLKVAEIFGYTRLEPTKQFYRLRCVSQHVYNDQVKVLNTKFEGTIGALVQRITRDLKIKNKTIESSSKSIIKGIYPSIKPIESIRWLMRNAYDKGTPFYFYETAHDQHTYFKSYDAMLKNDAFDEYEFRPGFINSIGSEEYYDEVRKRIKAIDGDLNTSQLYGIARGAYASTLHTLDIATKTYTKKTYNYKNKKLNNDKPFNGDEVLNKTYDQLTDSKNYYINLNSGAFGDIDNYHSPSDKTVTQYESQIRNLDFQTFNFMIPGDFELTVSMLIDLKIIKASDPEHIETKNLIDKYLSGRYIVDRITHVFDEEYNQRVRVRRDSIGVSLDA